jgi:hypothetical protein
MISKKIDVNGVTHTIQVMLPGVEICFPNPGVLPVRISWEHLPDVEFVADALGFMQVRDFRIVVAELGRMHANQHIYLALLSS